MRKKRTGKKEQEFPNQKFWFTISAVLILSTIAIFLFANPSLEDSLTGNTIQNIGLVKANSPLFMEGKVNGLTSATLYFNDEVKNVQVRIENPISSSWYFDGRELARFVIKFSESDKLDKIELNAFVEEKAMLDNNIRVNELKIFLNNEVLETKFVKVDRGRVYYDAVSPEIGEFVLGKAAVVEKPLEEVVPVVEESVETDVEQPIVEEPIEPMLQQPEEKGFFTKIKDFFANLFG